MTIKEFVEKYKVHLSVQRWHENPHLEDSNEMDHWKCRLRCGHKSMVIYYSMGYSHKSAKPTIEYVLDSLASDASTFNQTINFRCWAEDFGYDPDNYKAEKTYQAIEKQAQKLHDVLGGDAFIELVWNTERL